MTDKMTNEEIEALAEKLAPRLKEEMETDSLMLHAVPYVYGSPGILVDELKAKTSPCKCVEYKPVKKLCFSQGIIGALSDSQEKEYCSHETELESPALTKRLKGWQEAVGVCKSRLAEMPEASGEERMTTWMRCMSEELGKRGIET